MNKVYFTPTHSGDYSYLSQVAKNLMIRLITENNYKFEQNVPIKVHFGEKGNITFVPAIAYNGIIDYLEEQNIQSSYIETNVLYSGPRMYKDSHIDLAKQHGFTRLPIIIADGQIGENFVEIAIDKTFFKKCKIGAEFQNYSQIIVCSHFKGHMLSGFGGAIKQLAMGFAARGGKLDQHSKMCPTVRLASCNSCGKCIEKCGVHAISMMGKAYIDKDVCNGCAGCLAICPKKAITHDWGADNFLEKLAEYALAACKDKNFIYINFITNITKDCDCIGEVMQSVAENVGVMVSLDPVAIDNASLNALQKNSQSKIFEMGRRTMEYAENIGVGNRSYELVMV
jgi:hypothetical protein